LALKENQVYGAITASRQMKVVIFWSFFNVNHLILFQFIMAILSSNGVWVPCHCRVWLG